MKRKIQNEKAGSESMKAKFTSRAVKAKMEASEIKSLRDSLALTQFEMAQRVGVAPMTISRWERGISKPYSLADAVLRKLKTETEKKKI